MGKASKFNFDIDPKFVKFFDGRLHQAFIYLLNECNLDCKQCLYKKDMYSYLVRKDIDPKQLMDLIEDLHKLGATKLTLMGGEPTLYGIKQKRQPLFDVIEKAKQIGYDYVRIDTNGIFEASLLEHPSMKKLDEITFSLDGATAEINDMTRGKGTFDKIVSNIQNAVRLGYNVDITSCLHNGIKSESDIHQMADFVHSLGVKRLNFHNVLERGIARDLWLNNTQMTLDQWQSIWEEMEQKKDEYRLQLRTPLGFTTEKEFASNPSYYGYCAGKTGDRVLIHPDGTMRVCSLLIGTQNGIADYYFDNEIGKNKIVWRNNPNTNETSAYDMENDTACSHQERGGKFGNFKPTCVSFKPKQQEYVWDKLNWERHAKQ